MKKLTMWKGLLLIVAMLIGIGLASAQTDSTGTATPMPTTEFWDIVRNLVYGSLVPMFVQYLAKVNWSTGVKLSLTGLFSIALAVLDAGLQGHLSGPNWLGYLKISTMEILIAAWGFYNTVFKGRIQELLFPREALLTQGTRELKNIIGKYTIQESKNIINPTKPESMRVTVEKTV